MLYLSVLFIVGVLLSNILLPANWGNLSLFIINAAILSLITGLGADSFVIHSLVNNKLTVQESLYFTWRIAFFQLFLFLVAEAVSILLTDNTILSQLSVKYLLLEIAYFIGLILTEKYMGLFYSLHKAKFFNILLLVLSFIYLALLGILNYSFDLKYVQVLYIVCFQSLAQGILLFVFFHSFVTSLSLNPVSKSIFLQSFKLSLVIMVTNIIQFIAYRIDYWILKKFHGEFEVGLYAQSNKFANLMWIVPNIVALLLMPKFKNIREQDVPVIFRGAAACNILILATTICATEIFYSFFIDQSYYESLRSFYVLLPGYFNFSIVIYFGAYFSWQGKFFYNLIASSFCLITIFMFDLLLIPKYANLGAAFSSSFAYSATLILYVVLFIYKSPYHLNNLFLPKKSDLRILYNIVK